METTLDLAKGIREEVETMKQMIKEEDCFSKSLFLIGQLTYATELIERLDKKEESLVGIKIDRYC